MNFFKNKVVQIIAWIMLVAAAVILIIGGVTQAGITSVIAAVVGITSAVAELVILIGKLIKGSDTK